MLLSSATFSAHFSPPLSPKRIDFKAVSPQAPTSKHRMISGLWEQDWAELLSYMWTLPWQRTDSLSLL